MVMDMEKDWLLKRRFLQRRAVLFLALFSLISITGFLWIRVLAFMDQLSKFSTFSQYSQYKKCSFQTVSPWDPSIAPLIKRELPLECSSGPPLLVYQQDGFLKVNASKLESKDMLAYCFYKTLVMVQGTDFESVETFESDHFTPGKPIKLRPSDTDVVVRCYDKWNNNLSTMNLSFIIPSPSMEQIKSKLFENHVKKHKVEESLSILVMVIDGMSRNNLIRAMPETMRYLKETLFAIELVQYNKVGENTFPNLVPLFTGRPTTDFYNGFPPYGKWTWDQPLDKINDAFIWSEFQQAGYRTAVVWEKKIKSAFHCQMKKGWHKRYVDFTNRPTAVRNVEANCMYDVTGIEFLSDYVVQLATTFKNSKTTPYFGYLHNGILTHDDPNQASAGDLAHLRVLKRFKEHGLLHNTLLVYISDHGQRFGEMRNVRAGSIESKNPYAFLVFPSWFHEKYPNLIDTLRLNHDQLTTHFDVYATMKDLLFFQNKTAGTRVFSEYGRSLFSEISPNRTCKDAGIPVEFCNCFFLNESKPDDSITLFLVDTLKRGILELTHKFRNVCHPLEVAQVKSANRMVSYEGLTNMYQITVVTSPGDAIFKAILSYRYKARGAGTAHILGEISRLNTYRGTSECISDNRLKPFCFCRLK